MHRVSTGSWDWLFFHLLKAQGSPNLRRINLKVYTRRRLMKEYIYFLILFSVKITQIVQQ